MTNIIQKYTTKMATEQAKFIDESIKKLVPSWKLKILLKFNYTWLQKLLNVKIEIIHEELIADFGKRITVISGEKYLSRKFNFKI